MLAKNLDAEQALEVGLADGVATGEALQELVDKQCERLARLSPALIAENKRNLRALAANAAEDFGSASGFSQFMTNEFLGEGLAALLENRHPVFEK